jgi:hypothetical protein
MEWQKTFEFSAPVPEVWEAFWETDEAQVWNNPIKGDAYISAGAIEVNVTDLRPGEAVQWTETQGEERVEMSLTLEAIGGGTRLTLTRSGFGSGDDWIAGNTAKLQGWEDALHDLGLYLESGLALQRIHEWKCAFAVALYEAPGGLRAGSVLDGGFAEEAGIEPGDLVIRIAGAPVFRRSDQWLIQRLFNPGDVVEIEYVRNGEVLNGRGALSPRSMWRGG